MEMREILAEFAIDGECITCREEHGGHINTTCISSFSTGKRYTHQRINKQVFLHPEQVMENIVAVTGHIRSRLVASGIADASDRCLEVIPSRSGLPYVVDDEGQFWRTYRYIGDVATFEVLESPEQARMLGAAIGTFQRQLADFDGSVLHVTIPAFHDMHSRYDQLRKAIGEDRKGRVRTVERELAFLFANEKRGMVLIDAFRTGKLPLRVVHNDAKIQNVLFSLDGTEAKCIIDLDTVMPGTILYDVGDMIRTAVNTASEDAADPTAVHCDVERFAALLAGYRANASFLVPAERNLLVESGRTMTQIMAVRFLTDYLAGDTYYHIERSTQNLDRARSQIALIESMDRQWESLQSS